MNSEQRTQVRQSLIAQGFRRTGYTDDISAVGDYTETWTHPDGTTIDLTWAPRDTDPDDRCPECGFGTRDGRLACGPDCGQGTGMLVEDASATRPRKRFEQARPEVFAPFQHREVTITCHDDEQTETLTGYPVDAWRFAPDALGVRVVFEPGGDLGDYIVLPDDASWTVESTDGDSTYRHAPQVVQP